MKLILAAAALAIIGAAAPSRAHAAACPNDAELASYRLWAPNTLRGTVTASHPCGRRLTCNPGLVNVRGSRVCRWL